MHCLCEGWWGRGSGVGILLLQMTSSAFGGCGGPEIVELFCVCGVVCVDGLEKGESVSVLRGGYVCCTCACNLGLL